MESLENLRKNADHITEQAQGNDYARIRNIIKRHADEIEAEIAEKYMLLPVDADGVPIHVGDEMKSNTFPTQGVVTSVAPKAFFINHGTVGCNP